MTSVPILYTDRCHLSAVTVKEIPMLRQILDDAETQRFLPELCEVFLTEESLQLFIESFNAYLLKDEGILWGIYSDLSPTLMGFIAIMDLSTEPTLFYAMHPANRNQGFMKEGIGNVIDYIKSTHLCSIIQTEVYEENTISLLLLHNTGFTTKGKIDNKRILTFNLS